MEIEKIDSEKNMVIFRMLDIAKESKIFQLQFEIRNEKYAKN
jgi:hypothetical protein